MTVTWQREDWETRVEAAGLHPGARDTAMALADVADEKGVAEPGLLWLAEASRCSVSTAYQRVVRLLSAGWIERDGKSYVKPGGPAVPLPARHPGAHGLVYEFRRGQSSTARALLGGGWS